MHYMGVIMTKMTEAKTNVLFKHISLLTGMLLKKFLQNFNRTWTQYIKSWFFRSSTLERYNKMVEQLLSSSLSDDSLNCWKRLGEINHCVRVCFTHFELQQSTIGQKYYWQTLKRTLILGSTIFNNVWF